ncbi:hypothetical protein JCM3770_002599 [Rhodotorula araucariae]
MLAQFPGLPQLPLAGLTMAGAGVGGFPTGFTTTTSTGGTTGMASPTLHAQNDTAAVALPSAVGVSGWTRRGGAFSLSPGVACQRRSLMASPDIVPVEC